MTMGRPPKPVEVHRRPVTAPAVDQLRQVERSMLEHERVLGLGPLHRARLGLTVMSGRRELSRIEGLIAKRNGGPA